LVLYPVLVEVVRIEVDCSQLIGALERTLPQHGYRTLRSFDLPLVATADLAHGGCKCGEQCNCRYAVLLVSTNRPQTAPLETISIQGRGKSTVVTLLSPDAESILASQFALLLVEALRGVGAAPTV
jgi:hypothetical protein